MPRVSFFKYQATGNDFIILGSPGVAGPKLTAQTVRGLCDRHFGIGADGIMIMGPSQRADVRMEFFNADGSSAEMCGNGIRCLALHASAFRGENQIAIETRSGIKNCSLNRDRNGRVKTIGVEMGAVAIDRSFVSMKEKSACIGEAISVGGHRIKITAISVGNPHCVIFDKATPERVVELAELVRSSGFFPNGVNVEVAEKLSPATFKLFVHERGAGLTLSCGTGAVAATTAAALNGLASYGKEVKMILAGGSLYTSVSEKLDQSTLRGGASEVFKGEIDI